MLSKQQQQLNDIVSQGKLKNERQTPKSSSKLSLSFNPKVLLGQSLSPTHNMGIKYQQDLLKLMTSQKKLSSAKKKANYSEVISKTLTIQINNQRLVFDSSKTTQELDQYLKQLFDDKKSETGNEVIVAFHTVEKNLPIDYYLQQHNKTLDIFCGQTINLMPFYGTRTNERISLKDFIFMKCIGVGGFSRVYLVKKKSNGQFYAMKLIDKEFILQARKQGIVQNERDIMTVLNHPFIIKLECSFESKNFIVFVLEFCSSGELFWQLRQVKRMTEYQARFYFTEICLAMFYLHSLSVVYRDIKPENILIDIDGHIRIADFGLSKNLSEDDYAYSFCGSPEYMAPEMLLKVGHNVQVDHYCLGALLYELVTGLPPYYSRDTEKIYESVLNEDLTFPDKINLSPEIRVFDTINQDLLEGLLCKQPAQRLGSKKGLSELLQHVWFKDVDFVAMLQKKIPPPFKPDQLKFNYDSNDLMKGELETREKLLGKAGFQQDIRIFKQFYYDSKEPSNILEDHLKEVSQLSRKSNSLQKRIKSQQIIRKILDNHNCYQVRLKYYKGSLPKILLLIIIDRTLSLKIIKGSLHQKKNDCTIQIYFEFTSKLMQLEELLFKKSREPQKSDITITSYSEISDGTPNLVKKLYTEQHPKKVEQQISNSIMESMTPQKMNKLIDWSRYNVTPGDGKNIFPQVAGPSIEFSNENSLNFKQPSKISGNGDILLNKYMEMEEKLKLLQEKHRDYTSLEILRGKDLQIAQQKIMSQQEVIASKDNQLTVQEKKHQEQIKDKDGLIQNLEQQVTNLTGRLKKEMEYRKHDENLLSEIKLIQRSSVFEVNAKCNHCQSSKQELANILTECSIQDEQKLLESDLTVPVLIREVVTLLLMKQREQIDIAFQQYEEQQQQLTEQLEYYQKQTNKTDFFKSIQSDRSSQEQQFQGQIQQLLMKIADQEKQLSQYESFRNLSSNKKNKILNEDKNKLILQVQKLEQIKENEMKSQQTIKEKDRKNIELYNQNKVLQAAQKDLEQNILELKDELDKSKKKLTLKSQEIKQFIEQNKIIQDKNTELNTKILQLQQQLIQFENQNKKSDFSVERLSKSIEQVRTVSHYLQPSFNQVAELIDGYEQYQQEFANLKVMFTEKMKQHEILTNKFNQLQKENQQLNLQNSKLISEITQLNKRVVEELTTGVRCSAATGDSINIKSFIQHGDEEPIKKKFNILDLIQPELMSTEETMYILKEILIRSVRSVELIRKVSQITEIKELLIIIQQVDERYAVSNQKLTKVVSYVINDRRKAKMSSRSEKFNS